MRPAPGFIATSLGVALGVALSLSSPLTATARSKVKPKEDRACFYASNIRGFSPVDDRVINIEVGANDDYQLQLMGACPNIDFANALIIRSRNSNFICAGIDADIIYQGPGGPQSCQVSSIRKMSPAEVKALPRRDRR